MADGDQTELDKKKLAEAASIKLKMEAQNIPEGAILKRIISGFEGISSGQLEELGFKKPNAPEPLAAKGVDSDTPSQDNVPENLDSVIPEVARNNLSNHELEMDYKDVKDKNLSYQDIIDGDFLEKSIRERDVEGHKQLVKKLTKAQELSAEEKQAIQGDSELSPEQQKEAEKAQQEAKKQEALEKGFLAMLEQAHAIDSEHKEYFEKVAEQNNAIANARAGNKDKFSVSDIDQQIADLEAEIDQKIDSLKITHLEKDKSLSQSEHDESVKRKKENLQDENNKKISELDAEAPDFVENKLKLQNKLEEELTKIALEERLNQLREECQSKFAEKSREEQVSSQVQHNKELESLKPAIEKLKLVKKDINLKKQKLHKNIDKLRKQGWAGVTFKDKEKQASLDTLDEIRRQYSEVIQVEFDTLEKMNEESVNKISTAVKEYGAAGLNMSSPNIQTAVSNNKGIIKGTERHVETRSRVQKYVDDAKQKQISKSKLTKAKPRNKSKTPSNLAKSPPSLGPDVENAFSKLQKIPQEEKLEAEKALEEVLVNSLVVAQVKLMIARDNLPNTALKKNIDGYIKESNDYHLRRLGDVVACSAKKKLAELVEAELKDLKTDDNRKQEFEDLKKEVLGDETPNFVEVAESSKGNNVSEQEKIESAAKAVAKAAASAARVKERATASAKQILHEIGLSSKITDIAAITPNVTKAKRSNKLVKPLNDGGGLAAALTKKFAKKQKSDSGGEKEEEIINQEKSSPPSFLDAIKKGSSIGKKSQETVQKGQSSNMLEGAANRLKKTERTHADGGVGSGQEGQSLNTLEGAANRLKKTERTHADGGVGSGQEGQGPLYQGVVKPSANQGVDGTGAGSGQEGQSLNTLEGATNRLKKTGVNLDAGSEIGTGQEGHEQGGADQRGSVSSTIADQVVGEDKKGKVPGGDGPEEQRGNGQGVVGQEGRGANLYDRGNLRSTVTNQGTDGQGVVDQEGTGQGGAVKGLNPTSVNKDDSPISDPLLNPSLGDGQEGQDTPDSLLNPSSTKGQRSHVSMSISDGDGQAQGLVNATKTSKLKKNSAAKVTITDPSQNTQGLNAVGGLGDVSQGTTPVLQGASNTSIPNPNPSNITPPDPSLTSEQIARMNSSSPIVNSHQPNITTQQNNPPGQNIPEPVGKTWKEEMQQDGSAIIGDTKEGHFKQTCNAHGKFYYEMQNHNNDGKTYTLKVPSDGKKPPHDVIKFKDGKIIFAELGANPSQLSDEMKAKVKAFEQEQEVIKNQQRQAQQSSGAVLEDFPEHQHTQQVSNPQPKPQQRSGANLKMEPVVQQSQEMDIQEDGLKNKDEAKKLAAQKEDEEKRLAAEKAAQNKGEVLQDGTRALSAKDREKLNKGQEGLAKTGRIKDGEFTPSPSNKITSKNISEKSSMKSIRNALESKTKGKSYYISPREVEVQQQATQKVNEEKKNIQGKGH